MLETADQLMDLPLGAPPTVVSLGVGVHGTRRQFERWQLPELYALHVYSYHGSLRVNGQDFEIQPGNLSIIPPGSVMEYSYVGESEHLFAHLKIPASGVSRSVPTMRALGVEGPSIADRLRAATLLVNPAHRSAEIWSVLWRVALLAKQSDGRPDVHPAVQEAMNYVDAHFRESLTVPQIASAVRFSTTHLDRLFLAAAGVSLSAFVRQRRMETARHLLQETTQSISSIATSVGIPDLQAFNKACRRSLGASPRSIRGGTP
jgi:AraC-like DNA-binding protein